MSVGGSSSNQSGYQSSNTSGLQSGLNYALQNALSHGQSSSTSSTNPNVPAQNQAFYDQAGANLDPAGLTAAQRQALAVAQGQQGLGSTAVQTSINDLNTLKPGYLDLAGRSSTPITAAQASTPTGADFMGAYQSPYENAVVGTTLADFDRNTANTLNAMRASRGAGAAFGDRSALADEQFLNDQALKRAQTEAAVRQQGFDTGATLGQQDAARFSGANMFNAGQANQVAQNNAANALAFGNLDLNALNAAGNNAVNTSQLAQQGVRLNSDLGNTLFNYGGAGQGQLVNRFSAGNPLIGQTSTNNGTTDNASSSENFGANANAASSQSQGYNSSNGSSKGGRVGLSDFAKWIP